VFGPDDVPSRRDATWVGSAIPFGRVVALALLGLGLLVAAVTARGPDDPQDMPLSQKDLEAAARRAASKERLRAMAESVPDRFQPQFDRAPSNQPPLPGTTDPPAPPGDGSQ